MKSKALPLLAALLGPVLALPPPAAAQPVREDLSKVYEAGRTAFNKGDLATAKTAFARVLKASPGFDLARIYMAQIRHAEAQWDARPRSQKIAGKSSVHAVALTKATLADALEVVRRELERAGGGPAAGRIALLTDLPADTLERPMELSVRELPMEQFIDAVAYAGDVHIAWHHEGLSVTAGPASPAAPGAAAAAKASKQAARSQVLPHLQMEALPVREALAKLRQQMDPLKGPLLVAREPVSQAPVTLDLRNIPLSEALNSVAMVAGMEVTWHPWGAGLASKAELAAGSATEKP